MQPPMRYPEPPVLNNSYSLSVSENVEIPRELAMFTAYPQFKQILQRVKEQSGINSITTNQSGDIEDAESLKIDGSTAESVRLARRLIETHFRNQLKIKNAENRLQKVQKDLHSVQEDIAIEKGNIVDTDDRLQRVQIDSYSTPRDLVSGMSIEFIVDASLIGMILGKKGARIKEVKYCTI